MTTRKDKTQSQVDGAAEAQPNVSANGKKTRITVPVPEGHIRKVVTLSDEHYEFMRNVRRETGITADELIKIALNVLMNDPATHMTEAIHNATSVKLLRLKR